MADHGHDRRVSINKLIFVAGLVVYDGASKAEEAELDMTAHRLWPRLRQ